MNRTVKQLIYGTFYLAIWVGVFWGFYFVLFHANPSCTNLRQDENEEGVDCGGACESVCIPSDLSLFLPEGIKVLRPNKNNAILLAEIQNPNFGFSAKNFDYRLETLSATGESQRVLSRSSYIHGGEVKYFVEILNIPDSGEIAQGKISAGNIDWVSVEDWPKPRVTLQDKQISVGEKNVQIDGAILNEGGVVLPEVQIIALLSNQFGVHFGASETVLNDVPPNTPRKFRVSYPLSSEISSSTRVEVFVYSRQP